MDRTRVRPTRGAIDDPASSAPGIGVQLFFTARNPSTGRSTDVLVDAEGSQPAGSLVPLIADAVGASALDPVWVGHREVDGDAPIGLSGIRDGVVVEVGGAGLDIDDGHGSVDLCAAGGLHGGRRQRLQPGETVLVAGADGAIEIGGYRAGIDSAIVTVTLDGSASVRAARDGSAFLLESRPLGIGTIAWSPGALLRLGGTAVTVQPAARPNADVRPSEETGALDYNRPPRLLRPDSSALIRLPAAPTAPQRSPLPWITAAMPLVLGVATAVIFQQPTFLVLAVGSPLVAVGNWMMQRRQGRTGHRQRVRDHENEVAELQEEIDAALATEQSARRHRSPGGAELALVAVTPTSRLWERRTSDPDYLELRVGLAAVPGSLEIDDAGLPEHRRRSRPLVRDVPIIVALRGAVVGIAGPGDWPRRRARWLMAQLAVLHSPRDVQTVVLSGRESAPDWAWVAWTPHARPALGQDAVALIGTGADTVSARVAELTTIIAAREELREASRATGALGPDIVVVLDGARRLRALPGVVALLRDGPAVGVHSICLDADEQLLPEECSIVVVAGAGGELDVRRQNAEDVSGVLTDDIDDAWFDPVARSLSPVIDVTSADDAALIPDQARLVDLLGIPDPTADDIVARWRTSRGAPEALVGVSIDGPFTLDLVRDGPHGLVAGTTGAGKSEFLQTLVASLAVVNTPETMTFVLVDYKGGAAFSQAEHLPHTVGMVTDLDSHLVERALSSLRAELTHREHMLAGIGAKDLEDYVDAQARGAGGEKLPRLLIVIDEFASMARELPDFVSGLVNIAQRGRSLGIHLVLATQRPGGVVSPEIRANTNLRIALRMTDGSESSDVIDAKNAAEIPKSLPGRAFARLGHASLLPFQSARVGGRRLSRVRGAAVTPFLAAVALEELGRPVPRRPAVARDVGEDTDLSAVVAAVSAASEELRIARPRRPWLPPLPAAVGLDDLPPATGTGPLVRWGVEDIPDRQRQDAATIDLDAYGHQYIAGGPGSGRSTALRTIAAAAAAALPVGDVHLYAIDCGNGALAALAELPHCGAVVQRTQPERATRLLTRLVAELHERQEVLARGNLAGIAEQRAVAGEERLPHILLLIDRWESFTSTLGEADSGALLDIVMELLRDGATAGIHIVISGDRSLLITRVASLTDDKLVLRLTDRTDAGLAGINYRRLPDEIPDGRGFRSGSGIEVQIAILGDDPSGRGQAEAVRAIAATARQRPPAAVRPFRVDDLPKTLPLSRAWDYAGPEASAPMWALAGIGGDDLRAFGADLAANGTFLVAGPPKSGKSSMLRVMAESLLRGGTPIVVASPRPGPLRELDGRDGVRAVITAQEPAEQEFVDAFSGIAGPAVLVVDDGELLRDAPAAQWLKQYVRTGADEGRAIVVAGDVSDVGSGFSGWLVEVRKGRAGAILSPGEPLDGDLIGVRLPRSITGRQIVLGRAHAHFGGGEIQQLLVPDPAL